MNRNDFTSKTDCFTLANGVKIPCIGYGTWGIGTLTPRLPISMKEASGPESGNRVFPEMRFS